MKGFLVVFAVLLASTVVNSGKLYLPHPMNARIINGEEANPNEFPHQALLRTTTGLRCGGSVIAKDWVLTAAHCVDGLTTSSLSVAVNVHNHKSLEGATIFAVNKIVKHNRYNQGSGAFPNDVAVLKLETNEYNFTENVISLASGSHSFAGEKCVISGWGVTEHGSISDVLRKAEVTALSMAECQSIWGNNILDQHICVKGEGTTGTGSGACNGDSGGPLVCSGVLAGVTSWGRSGCHTNGDVTHPSVYARVSSFFSWVRTNCEGCV